MEILHEIAEYIGCNTIVDINSLKKRFPGRSVPSFHRDLAKLKCVTCFTENSRYYTLPDTPNYDEYGLWRYGNIVFSENGTAKETVRTLIEKSSSGMSHSELQNLLGIRIYNPLRALVQEKSIISLADGKKLLFFSRDEVVYLKQRESRTDTISVPHTFNLNVVIDVLLAVYQENKVTVESAYRFIKTRKYPYITQKEVEDIFVFYELPGKKN